MGSPPLRLHRRNDLVSILKRLEPGERLYMGYGEWMLSFEEADAIIGKGHATVDGIQQPVYMIGEWEGVGVQMRVYGTNTDAPNYDRINATET